MVHGHRSGGRVSGTYQTWRKMHERCRDSRWYTKIKVCARWLKFENFLKDMGERPPGKTLDRINNKRGYCKSNCRWATPMQQANNRRNTLVIEGFTLREWSDMTGICYATLKSRYQRTGTIHLKQHR